MSERRLQQTRSTRSVPVQVLNTRYFRRQFLSSLSREVIKLAIVSPYVTPIPGFRTTHEFFSNLVARLPDASLELVTAPPDDDKNNALSWQEAELIDRLGVNLTIRPNKLHSKVYYVRYLEGDSSSFVGSANFTKGGFANNDETVAFWRRSEPDREMEKELARLTGPGSFNLLQWLMQDKSKTRNQEVHDGD